MYGQAQQPVPKATEVLELAEKSLGGDAFFNPKPYRITLTTTGYDPDGEKTYNRVDNYKNGKHHIEQTVLTKKTDELSTTTYTKSITDIAKRETWVWNSREGDGYKKGRAWPLVIPIQYMNIRALKDMVIFGLVTVVAQDGKDYYRFEVKYKDPKQSHWRITYLIDTKTHLVYKMEFVNTKDSTKAIYTYTNYTRVGGIMVPKKITEETTGSGLKQYYEHNISKFEFANDIPDSLFVVPKK
jgi:hypothetical protein